MTSMNALMVYAHPERQSFDAQMKAHALTVLKEQGYFVQISDLYAMRFRPLVSHLDYIDRADDSYFDIFTEQRHASKHGTYAVDIMREQQKLVWADIAIFQFPLWWYAPPAIMKGWFDRVLTHGFAYGEGHSLAGRRAMLVMTTGGPARVFTQEMRDTLNDILGYIQQHTLAFCGFEVLPPFAVYGAASATPGQRQQYLEHYTEVLQTLDRIVPLSFD